MRNPHPWQPTVCSICLRPGARTRLAGVIVLLERLLASCPRLVVLATSRARLLVPFEWVFPVPGLSLDGDASGPGDAAELFLVRAGHPVVFG